MGGEKWENVCNLVVSVSVNISVNKETFSDKRN